MFSVFKKNVIKVVQTDQGQHGQHWFTLYNSPLDTDKLWQRVVETAANGKQIIKDKIGIATGDSMRVELETVNNSVITTFPYFKGNYYQPFKTALISEWSHVDNIEAIITVEHAEGPQLKFFATDYAFHKKSYQENENISLNLVGMGYSIKDFEKLKFSDTSEIKIQIEDDFCGFFPDEDPDTIFFVGHVQQFEICNLSEVEGYKLVVDIAPKLFIEIFIAKINLSTELVLGKHISGYAWLQGTLEK